MYPSTDATDAQCGFAAAVLRKLLRHIECESKNEGRYAFLVSHAWTEGPMMYVVYTAPPSDITWGLVRDTRKSIINPSPWPDLDEAVLYYYLLDFEEDWPGRFSRQPGEPDSIRWFGHRHAGLPERPSDIPEAYRYTPSMGASCAGHRREPSRPVTTEPRRYADPFSSEGP